MSLTALGLIVLRIVSLPQGSSTLASTDSNGEIANEDIVERVHLENRTSADAGKARN